MEKKPYAIFYDDDGKTYLWYGDIGKSGRWQHAVVFYENIPETRRKEVMECLVGRAYDRKLAVPLNEGNWMQFVGDPL